VQIGQCQDLGTGFVVTLALRQVQVHPGCVRQVAGDTDERSVRRSSAALHSSPVELFVHGHLTV
jgi:hypothetical protein